MPWRLRPRSTSRETSASSVGSTRSSTSNSSTSLPSRAKPEAISAPEAPAPTTASRVGSSGSAHACSVPITRPPSSTPGIERPTEPVARTTVAASSSSLADAHFDWAPTRPAPAVGAALLTGGGRERGLADDHLDPVFLEQPPHAAGERSHDLLASRLHRGVVDLDSCHASPYSPASRISLSKSAERSTAFAGMHA